MPLLDITLRHAACCFIDSAAASRAPSACAAAAGAAPCAVYAGALSCGRYYAEITGVDNTVVHMTIV